MHATWSRIGHPPEVPVTGERKSVKILGAIELWQSRFHYRRDTVFNATTYFAFLEQPARHYRRRGAIPIQDNASYHKNGEVWKWVGANRHWLEVHQLPPYSPEFNPTERLWQQTRKNGTHNRYFANETELPGTDPILSASFLSIYMSLYLCAAVQRKTGGGHSAAVPARRKTCREA